MEFLIRVVDKGIAEAQSRRGDVISACVDGWAWSASEKTNPDWRIVSVLGVAQATVDSLMSQPQSATGRKNRREWTVDFSLLPNPALFSGARTQAIISLTKAQVVAAAKKKR